MGANMDDLHLQHLADQFMRRNDTMSRDAFLRQLAVVSDIASLRRVAELYTPHTEISVPIYRRLLELRPSDFDAMVALGFVYWLDGSDDKAWEQVSAVRRVDPDHVGASTLEAALTRDKAGK